MTPQEQLQKKYDEIEERIIELEKVRSESYKTSGQFRYNPSNSYSSLNIKTTQDQVELINVNAFIQNKAKQYNESAEQLGLNTRPIFEWMGYTPELWFHDIQLRFKVLTLDTVLNKLKEQKQKIQPYLPHEHKIKQLLIELN